jgi:hypothetical protein
MISKTSPQSPSRLGFWHLGISAILIVLLVRKLDIVKLVRIQDGADWQG